MAPRPELVAIFGPTSVGKTAVAIALAERLRERGQDPVAVSCDAIQAYRGLEVISGAPDATERAALEHRLVGVVEVTEEFSAGRFAELARREIDAAIAAGRLPIVVGGTGLYMRAALAELELQPPVPAELRAAVEAELGERGAAALHGELPEDVRSDVHPNDRKRIARATELLRAGLDPPERGGRLWSERLRRPTALVGLICEPEALNERIDARVGAMAAAGAGEEARALEAAGASRTARAALGFEAFLSGDLERARRDHRRYAKRQMTWLRKMPEIVLIEHDAGDAERAAERILALLGDTPGR
jgi:tRNA dimethylallyltransferase